MKKLLALGLLVMLLALPSFKPAQAAIASPAVSSAPIGNYAVIAVPYIMSKSKAIAGIQNQMKAYTTKLENYVKQKQKDLQNEAQQLSQKQSLLSPKAFEQAKVEFQQKVQNAQKDLEQKKQKLQKSNIDAVAQVEKTLGTIVAKIAADKKYELVFSSATLATYPQEKDISEDVVKALNSKLPKVKVPSPF